MSKREQNKADKLERIKNSALSVLAEKGYNSTTMSAIASTANVAIGTLFLYADNKRDIVFLAIGDEFIKAQSNMTAVSTEISLVDQIIALFKGHFEVHCRFPSLSSVILSEFTFFNGRQAQNYNALIHDMKAELLRRIGITLAETAPCRHHDVEAISDLVFFIFQGVIRRWASGATYDLDQGLQYFRKILIAALGTETSQRAPGPDSAEYNTTKL